MADEWDIEDGGNWGGQSARKSPISDVVCKCGKFELSIPASFLRSGPAVILLFTYSLSTAIINDPPIERAADSGRFHDREPPKPASFDKFDAAAPRDSKPDNDKTCNK